MELKPLAKRAEDPRYTEMFQLLVHGFELSNNYTELNDHIDQRVRFEEQAKNKAEGDDEAMQNDWDYVDAMEHGMPPATGTGIGIDRLVMLLTNTHSIREVIAFPMMKPLDDSRLISGKAKKTKVAHAVILDGKKIPEWSKLNAAAHLTASLAAREGRSLLHMESSSSADGERIPMNIQHAIVMKQAEKSGQLLELKRAAESAELEVTCFTEAMRDTSDDAKVDKEQSAKNAEDIMFLGVLVFGPRKQVEKLTKEFPMWK